MLRLIECTHGPLCHRGDRHVSDAGSVAASSGITDAKSHHDGAAHAGESPRAASREAVKAVVLKSLCCADGGNERQTARRQRDHMLMVQVARSGGERPRGVVCAWRRLHSGMFRGELPSSGTCHCCLTVHCMPHPDPKPLPNVTTGLPDVLWATQPIHKV